MTEELQKKAEDFIIERYKLAKCYREDNAETREYMRMDVHSQYEEEYQLYLDATKELQKENAELKDNFKIAKDNEYEYSSLLTKAKELLAKWVELFKPKGGNIPPTPIQVETEQFLKDNGCPNCLCEDCNKDCGIKKLGLV